MSGLLRRGILGTVAICLLAAAPAQAAPVATSASEYDALGAVFPDPLAGCTAGSPVCDPNANGNVPAIQFIQIGEFTDALTFMNSNPAWQRYLEVQVLDGQFGANGPGEGPADADIDLGDPGDTVFPGNNVPLEYDPKPEYRSAGLPTSSLGRAKSDLIVLRVTDETVPDAGKERYALSLSIHGIERAGVEGGTRAMEDLVTAETTGRSDEPIVPPEAGLDFPPPTFAEVLRESIIYFTYPNPDGWRRGSITDGGIFFQRYNGNGVDVNRDWPDIGFTFRPYTGLSEPESRGLAAYLDDVEGGPSGGEFALGDDLHGQPFADALSYTLLPHGRHDFAKNQRIRNAAIAIHRASEQALAWSPKIKPNEADGIPKPNPACLEGPIGAACPQIYGQTWGTVYDTINYTTTGALGDYFDSTVGLGADGIDNEMSFSHLDKNILFEPQDEQLHVAGNKALIYARLVELVGQRSAAFEPSGTQGYVPNLRVKRDEKPFTPTPPPNTVAQDDISGQMATIGADGTTVFPFTVERSDPAGGQPGIYSGGMRVDVTTTNFQGVATGSAHLRVQCRGCDEHPGVTEDDDWVTVSEDFNQSPLYAQAGVTVAINRPDPFTSSGDPVEWRAVLDGDVFGVGTPNPSPVSSMDIDFTRGPATTDGATGGDDPPVLAGYDVASTDFLEELDPFIPGTSEDFDPIDPADVIGGTQSLAGLDHLVLADDPLPGYTGDYGDVPPPTGPPTADFDFQGSASAPGASSGVPGTFEEFPFTVGPNDANGRLTVRIEWAQAANDFDMFLERIEENGDHTVIGQSTQTQGESDFEEIVINDGPPPGDYVIRVDNFASADPAFDGTARFAAPTGGTGGTGAYTVAEKDAWFAALEQWVRAGGNLVLTDGALRALPELTGIDPADVDRQTVYAGQIAFATADDEDTLADPLAKDVGQEGARFGTGMRRQVFEPTPLGFAIQDSSGADQSNSRQYDVDRAAWEAAGGTIAATSVDAGDRDAQAVFDRVTLGELALGQGQVRIAGALLPQPTQEFDHTLGLEPFATTYTAYIVFCNLVDCTVDNTVVSPPPGGEEPPGGGTPPGGTPPGGTPPPGGGGGGACSNQVIGTTDSDKLSGTGGSDRLSGRRGNDKIAGRGGNDCVRGGAGKDRLAGNGDNDEIKPGRGADRIKGGPGRDTVRAARGGRDRISCGPGKDKAFINAKLDRTRSCERIRER
jgi:hypothetical protein